MTDVDSDFQLTQPVACDIAIIVVLVLDTVLLCAIRKRSIGWG
jgi:hypothetical protein